MTGQFIERRALRILQNDGIPLYLFALAAAEIDLVADVARISRDQAVDSWGTNGLRRRPTSSRFSSTSTRATSCFRTGSSWLCPHR